ncbi:HAD family hydrolase [Thalassotalea sp. PP2-459]|uniref:HAD family hydrolase n=1 Tax=Thalassotalea sp. PP2-459 TaxID=1742724 RepID=UPI000942FFA0|nr:HAD-IA family hydrolase [Thalassotalea sp. PP2-459]OKY25424.1 phosphoglycolate phosphatase [Thalassotalea sp. PP2-459]
MKNNKYQGVLFDLDGTLLDTANDLGAALNYVLSQFDLPTVEKQVFRPVASDGAQGLLALGFADKITEYDQPALRRMFLDYYEENLAAETCLYPEVPELLQALNERDIPWGIVTNKPEYLTTLLLPNFTEFTHSQVMVGGDSLAERKPHPLPLLHAAEHIGVAPEQCLYVGDALRDIQAGNAANMSTAIAQWGYIKEQDNLATWQAKYISASPEKLLSII